ncbi:MAG: DEAD/DEAH box helicase family protein [Phycisphaerales bacterium]|nr:DEAD/DEAH box helicase family protein [Phycisphaerales bacterium]
MGLRRHVLRRRLAKRRSNRSVSGTLLPGVAPLRFDQRLVLNRWLLHLFEVERFEQLAEGLKDPRLEGFDENNISRHAKAIVNRLFNLPALPPDVLFGYDQNIVRHTLEISAHRHEPIRWKYFQYLALLFAEIYLDRYFRDPGRFLDDLNAFVAEFNRDKPERDRVSAFEGSDLNRVAFWCATGSGKTLLMHVNIRQYQHYLDLHHRRRELNRVILLTPNEGLSRQHLVEFHQSGIDAELFSKDGRGLFSGRTVEIIDIHKLKEVTGEKTVAVEAFEGNNLVLVDEGHRGASGGEVGAWMRFRNALSESGFSFEYSATFGQAVKGNEALQSQYAKCILFDYSYKYFYRDGFGKDYRILNLADDHDAEIRRLYLTACLLAFHQQQRLFQDRATDFRPFLLEAPLWVFVGGRVNAVRTERGQQISDVIAVLKFLAEFVRNERGESVACLNRLLSGRPGVLDPNGQEVFSNAFTYLITSGVRGDELFSDILRITFNANSQAALHVENLKGTDGEIALRLGDNDPFGVINVGDASKLCQLCEQHDELVVAERDFGGSLFHGLNAGDSTVNVLIGSKKFTEGWNSWRVSTMGLMNIGRTEGSEIIQLFGRGVRLKGYGLSLKRSRAIDDVRPPQHINLLETLNIFGIRADYMRQFKEYLEEEGLPPNEDRIEFVLPVIRNIGTQRLKTLRIREGMDFKRNGPKPTLGLDDHLRRHPIVVDWYPKVQSQQSRGVVAGRDPGLREQGRLERQHLAFMDLDCVFFELEQFKAERAWHNMNLRRERIAELLASPDWYTLYIPHDELEFRAFEQVRRWEEVAVALLKKYAERYYTYHKDGWERQHLTYVELTPDDPNFFDEYRILIERSREDIATSLQQLKEIIESGRLRDFSFAQLDAFFFGQHLYQPLLHVRGDAIEITPVPLNEGEKEFVLDLRAFYQGNRPFFEAREIYLLRNLSRGRGIGFFEAGNFHPDFLLWLLADDRQYITFIDPKGLRNLEGPDDPKIRFHATIKEIEARLNDPAVILNSFIVSSTPFRDVGWWGTGMAKREFEARHVVFQRDDKATYIAAILASIVGPQS